MGPKFPKTPIFGTWIGISSQICEKFKQLYLQICVSDWHEIWHPKTRKHPKSPNSQKPQTLVGVSYGGKTIPRWRTAAILKIDISPHLSEKSSDFHYLIKNEEVALDRLRVRQNVFLVSNTIRYDRMTWRAVKNWPTGSLVYHMEHVMWSIV